MLIRKTSDYFFEKKFGVDFINMNFKLLVKT